MGEHAGRNGQGKAGDPWTAVGTVQSGVHRGYHQEDRMAESTRTASPYMSLENHETVKHSHLEYVRGPVHANERSGPWKPHMTFHKISTGYVAEFAGRHNMRSKDTLDQLALVADQISGSGSATRIWSGESGVVHPSRKITKKLDDMETIERLPWIRDVCGRGPNTEDLWGRREWPGETAKSSYPSNGPTSEHPVDYEASKPPVRIGVWNFRI